MNYSNKKILILNSEELFQKELVKNLNLVDDNFEIVTSTFEQDNVNKEIYLNNKKKLTIKKFDLDEINNYDIIIAFEPLESTKKLEIKRLIKSLENFKGIFITESSVKLEIKEEKLKELEKNKKILFVENTSTFILNQILEKIKTNKQLESLSFNGLISLSNFGEIGINTLYRSSKKYFEASVLSQEAEEQDYDHTVLKEDVAFNFIPNFGKRYENETNYNNLSQLEQIITQELEKNNQDLSTINVNCSQIPTFRCDYIYIEITTKEDIKRDLFISFLEYIPNLNFEDNFDNKKFDSIRTRDILKSNECNISKIKVNKNKISFLLSYDNISFKVNQYLNILEDNL